MATNIPPHHLGEVVDAVDRPHRQPRGHERRPVPDRQGPGLPDRRLDLPLRDAAQPADRRAGDDRRDPRDVRARPRARRSCARRCTFEEARQDRTAIIVTELPYQVNKASLLEKIADLVKDKKIDGISDLRDESDRDGMRIYIEIKRDANPHKVLNNLFKHTAMQTSFNLNMLALVDGQPQTLSLKSVISHYIDPPPRDRPAPDGVRPREGAGTGTHPRGPQDRPRQSRRGHRDHPRVGGRREGAQQPDGALRAVGAAGPGDPGHAARPPRGPRAPEDRGRVPRGHPAHRGARGHPRQPGARALDHQGRAGRAEAQVRRRAPDARRRRLQPRDDRRGPDRRRGRRRHDQPPRLHQAPAGRDLPPPAPRRQGDHRPRDPRGGRRRAPPGGEHARLGAVLHEPGPRVQREGPQHPRREPPGQGDGDHQPAGRPGGVRRVPGRDDLPAQLRARPLPRHGDQERDHQEDPARAVRARALHGDPGDHDQRRRRAGVGRRRARARTT